MVVFEFGVIIIGQMINQFFQSFVKIWYESFLSFLLLWCCLDLVGARSLLVGRPINSMLSERAMACSFHGGKLIGRSKCNEIVNN